MQLYIQANLRRYNVIRPLRSAKLKEEGKLRMFAKTIPARSQSNQLKSSKDSSWPPDVYQELISYAWAADFFVTLFWHRYLDDCLGIGLNQCLRLRSENSFKQWLDLLLYVLICDRPVNFFTQCKAHVSTSFRHLVYSIFNALFLHQYCLSLTATKTCYLFLLHASSLY